MKPYVICYRGVAHPWLCDSLGHLNTRHYMAMFDDAMQHFFAILGFIPDEDHGWADVKHEIEYAAEIPPGSLVHIDAAIQRVGGKSISYRQRLMLTGSEEEAASCSATTVLFSLTERKAVEVPQVIRENAPHYTLSTDGED